MKDLGLVEGDRPARPSGPSWALGLGFLLVSLQALAAPEPSVEDRMREYRVTIVDVLRVEEGVRGAEPELAKVWARIFADRRLPYENPSLVSVPPKGTKSACRPVVPFALNNAFYCRLDDTIYYDPIFLTGLRRMVADQTGRSADSVPIVTLAHEWGHAVQNNLSTLDGISRLVEQDADCYAGVGLRAISHAPDPEADLPVMESFFRLAADPPDSDRSQLGMAMHFGDAGAHGSLFDRLIAFKDGYRKGIEACQAQDRWRSLIDKVAPR